MTEAGRPVYHNPGELFFEISDQILKSSFGAARGLSQISIMEFTLIYLAFP